MSNVHDLAVIDHPAQEELVVRRPPAQVLDEARKAAQALGDVLAKKSKPVIMNGEQYLEYEDWQTIGRFYGVTVKVVETAFVDYGGHRGFSARAVALRSDGFELSAADSACLDDEDRWRGKPLFQVKSMAQTRACAKVLRNVLAWVVVLAGYKATPAEELETELRQGGPAEAQNRPQQARSPQAPAGTPSGAPNVPTGVLTVLRVAVVNGDKGGKPWTRGDVFLSDDRKASTFDRKVWERAEQLKGCPVIVDVVPGKNGRGLNLEMIADAPKAQQPEPDVPDEPVSGPEAVLTVRKLSTPNGDRWEICTARRRLLTAQEGHATEAVAARKAKLGIVPAFDVVQTADGRTFNKLTGFVVETPAEREPGIEG